MVWVTNNEQASATPTYPRDIVVGKDRVVRSIDSSFNATDMDALIQQLLAP